MRDCDKTLLSLQHSVTAAVFKSVLWWLTTDNTPHSLLPATRKSELLKVMLFASPNGQQSLHVQCCQVYCCIFCIPMCGNLCYPNDILKYDTHPGFYAKLQKKKKVPHYI